MHVGMSVCARVYVYACMYLVRSFRLEEVSWKLAQNCQFSPLRCDFTLRFPKGTRSLAPEFGRTQGRTVLCAGCPAGGCRLTGQMRCEWRRRSLLGPPALEAIQFQRAHPESRPPARELRTAVTEGPRGSGREKLRARGGGLLAPGADTRNVHDLLKWTLSLSSGHFPFFKIPFGAFLSSELLSAEWERGELPSAFLGSPGPTDTQAA